MVMYTLYLRLRVGSHTLEFWEIFGCSQLSFRCISLYELGLMSLVGIFFLLNKYICIYLICKSPLPFRRSFLWWQTYLYPLYIVLFVIMPMIVILGFVNTVVTKERSYPQ